MATSLTNYKKIKKLSKAVNDLTEIQKLLSLALHGFSTYKKYVPVRDVLSSIMENKALIDLYLKKFKKSLDELNEDQLD